MGRLTATGKLPPGDLVGSRASQVEAVAQGVLTIHRALATGVNRKHAA